MLENTNDQKGQGYPKDQKDLSGQKPAGNYGKTSDSSNTLKKTNEERTDEITSSKGNTGSQVSPENTGREQATNTGANAGIQNQGRTAPPKEKDKNDVNNQRDEDKEELHEYEDFDHPHKVDTPKATEQNNWETGENSVEGEDQGPGRITNKAEDKPL